MPKTMLPIEHKKTQSVQTSAPQRWEPFSWFTRPGLFPFGQWFEDLWNSPLASNGDARLAPPMDVVEKPDELILTAEIPGIRKEDVKIELEDGLLSISGHKEESKTEETEQLRRSERRYGAFYRSMTLPASVNAEKILAEMENGVLTVHLPKREAAKPKTIPVK
jgi:HSP20 family protein